MSDYEGMIRAIELAQRNIHAGVIREPRIYFDSITTDADANDCASPADPDVFRNGEEYPVRLHAMTVAVLDPAVDERNIQRVGLRLSFHDSFYMRRDFIAVPAWHNKPVAASLPLSFGQSSWRFHTPFILSSRDAMAVRVALESAPANAKTATIAFTGVGLDSRRPYFKASSIALDNAAVVQLNPEDFRNDGDEPVLVFEMSLHVDGDSQANNPAGDIRDLLVDIRQVGNGTQAQWVNAVPGALCPAVLLGHKSGRAVVHEFPGEGLLWEPGEGLRVELAGLAAAGRDVAVGVALLGTIEVL